MANEYLTFSGVQHPVGLQCPRTHGVFPNQVVLWCLPQAGNIPAYGTLAFGGSDGEVAMQMYVDRPTYRYSVTGHKIGLILLDRRVRWKWSRITGRYNVPRPDGTLINEKTPQELATLLFEAMGEGAASVSALPTAGRPEIYWDADRADLQLQKLCELYGCEPTLALNDQAGIVRLSVGATVPTTGPIQSLGITVDPPEVPQILRLICGATLFQFRMLFEAVGIDTDGQIKPVDDLSYKPTGGWVVESDWNQFPTVDTELGRYLAALSVGRWFRVKAFADGSLDVPVLDITLDSINQILPLEPDLLDVTITSGVARRAAPEVIAKHFVEGSISIADNTEDPERVETAFSLIAEIGLIKFATPVLYRNDDDQFEPSEVFGTVAFSIERDDTLIDLRQEYETSAGGSFGVETIRHSELFRTIIGRYSETTDTAPTSIDDNEATVASKATAILSEALSRYTTSSAGTLRLAGLFPINPDGVTRQVVWLIETGESGGFFTMLAANTESLPYAPRLADRRQWRVSREQDNEPGPAARVRRLKQRGIRP